MNRRLLRRWASFVLRHSLTPVWPYFCLLLTLSLLALEFTPYAHFHFLLIAALLTLMAFERWGFAQLLAEKDAEIKRLRGDSGGDQQAPPN